MNRVLLVLVVLLIASCGGEMHRAVPERNVESLEEQPREYAAKGEREEMGGRILYNMAPRSLIFADLLNLTQLGYIHYPSKRSMDQGRSEILYTEIFMQKPEVLPYGVTEDTVRVARIVCVDLVGHDNAFTITRVGERCQLVAFPSTTWKWAVLPILSGEHSLELVVINKLEIEGEESARNELTKTATVKVDVSVKYMVTNFLKIHWEWFMATLGTVAAYFLNRKRKSKVK